MVSTADATAMYGYKWQGSYLGSVGVRAKGLAARA